MNNLHIDFYCIVYYGGIPIMVIRLGLEPRTHSLEGCCSNPTELPNQSFYYVLHKVYSSHYIKNSCQHKDWRTIFVLVFAKVIKKSLIN